MSPAIELTDDPGVLRFTSPTGVKDVVKKSLGARAERKGDGLLLPATTLSVQRLIDYYGHAILEGAPDVAVELGTAEWGFRGFDPDERDRAEAHRSWGKMLPFQRDAIEYLVCNPHAAALLGLSPGLGKSAVSIVAADLLGLERILVLAPVSLTFNWQREFELWAEDPDARSFKRATADDREPGDGVTIANHEVIQEVVVRDEDGQVMTEFEIGDDENGDPVVVQATNAREVRAWIDAGPFVEDPKSGRMKAKRERLIRVRRDYRDAGWDGVIVDESILLKNRKAKKTEVLTTLRKSMDGDVWMLSGSPTAKFRDDLWRQLNIAAPRAFTSYWRFAEFFCVVEKGQWGWSIVGDAPDVNVHKYLRDYVFIRSQDDVLPDLPDYVIRDLELMPTKQQRKALDSMIDDWIAVLDSAPDEPVIADNWLSRMTRLQQLTSNVGSLPKDDGTFHRRSSAKEDALVDLIEQGDIELPLLVWTWYVETTNSITERLSGKFKDLAVGKVIGGGKRAETDATIEAFKSGELDVLVLQMGVGKFGHTFTGTRTIYYHDRAFDSDAWVQSLRRVRRIGLKHRPVLIVPRLQREDPDDDRVSSADQIIDENLAGKMRSIADMTNSDLASLLGRRGIDG